MTQENPLAHLSGAVARANGLDFLTWTLPDQDLGPWLYQAPLLFTLLHQFEPANVLTICSADSALPQLLRALPDTLVSTTPVAVLQFDAAPDGNDAPAGEAATAIDSDDVARRLKAGLDGLPAQSFNLVLIDLPLSEPLIAAIQGEALARVTAPGAVMGLHGADRTPAGAQLAINVRLTQPHLTNADGASLIVFPVADDPQPLQLSRDRLAILRTLGRAYDGIATERRKNQGVTETHGAELTELRQRQSLLESTNKAQTAQLLEQSARLSDAGRAIAALPTQVDARSVQSARVTLDKLRDKAAGGIDVPAGVIRVLDAIDTLHAQVNDAASQRDDTLKEAQAIVAQLRIKEAELLKSNHAIARMTQELAALAVVVESSSADMAELRAIAKRKAELDSENRKLNKKLAEAATRERRLEKQIKEFVSSTSWRISAPVRAVGKILRRR